MTEKSAGTEAERNYQRFLRRYLLLRNRLVWMSVLCLGIICGAMMLTYFDKIPGEWGIPIAGGSFGPWVWVWFLAREAELELFASSIRAEGVQ